MVRLIVAVAVGVVVGATVGAGTFYWFTRDETNPYQALAEQGVAFAREEPSGQCTTWVVDQAKQNRVFACYHHDGTDGVRRGHIRAAVLYQSLTTFEKGAAANEIHGRFAAEAFADETCISQFKTSGDPVERGDSVLYLVYTQVQGQGHGRRRRVRLLVSRQYRGAHCYRNQVATPPCQEHVPCLVEE